MPSSVAWYAAANSTFRTAGRPGSRNAVQDCGHARFGVYGKEVAVYATVTAPEETRR